MSNPTPEPVLPVIKVSNKSMHVLQQRGIDVETIGLQRIFSGSAAITLETAQVLQEDLMKAILACEDPEGKAALSNAWANVVKAVAAKGKAIASMPSAQPEGSKRKGKSFAPAAPIDVNPKP